MTGLGQLLAYALRERDGGTAAPPVEGIDAVRESVARYRSEGHHGASITVPSCRTCLVGKPFLQDNFDFFLRYLAGPDGEESAPVDCDRLFRHLNDCTRCFDIYTDVVQDFFMHKDNHPPTELP
jgi:hypothetical protein